MFDGFAIPDSDSPLAAIEGVWTKRTHWDWHGKVSATAPIVGVSFLKVGSLVQWARSEKGPNLTLGVRLHLGRYDLEGRDVQVSFSIGSGQPYTRTLLATADFLPRIPAERTIPVGHIFSICEPFGEPKVELFGIVIFKDQVIGVRNGLWHLKAQFAASLPEPLARALTYGRSGEFSI
ncbi:MAG TPA: hypothetical protein VF773_08000 [Verrucomicrobiae bacterium]